MCNLIRLLALLGMGGVLSGCLSTGNATQSIAPVAQTKSIQQTPMQLLEPLKGGLIGGSLGNGLTAIEKQRGLIAEYQALETSFGQSPVAWQDETTGTFGEVVAGAPYRVGQQDCRPFTHKLTVIATVSTANGSACRQSTGSWLLLD